MPASTQIPDLSKLSAQFGTSALEEINSIAAELHEREMEALRCYTPLPFQQRFLDCMAKECALIAGNMTGKSLAGFVEDAFAVTGQHPIKGKYPERDGILVCLGMDVDHIGLVMHRYLFQEGAFDIIRDQHTNQWRTFRRNDPGDRARAKEARPAPPLIPQRFIKDIAWEKKNERIFSIAELTTGWKIYAMGSKGDPKQGFQADMVHIDEDLERSDWYQEMIGRLTMRDGRLRWTAMPHIKNDALVNLIERAEEERSHESPSTVVIRATVFDNPYQDAKTREENVKRWKQEGDDVYRKRALGELVTDSILMYPTFAKEVHALRLRRERLEDYSPLELAIRQNNDQIPSDWTRYATIDPGHTVCAVVFFAVPPPALGDHVVAYQELYLHNCDAAKFGRAMKEACRDQTYQAFIIDAHGAALRDIGSGVTPREQYSKQLREANIYSEETKHEFFNGSDDVQGRAMRLREWLGIREDGTTFFKIIPERCPNLVREFARFKKKKIKDMVVDEPDTRTPCHAVQCVEYSAARGLKYVRPKSKAKFWNVVDAYKARKAAAKEKRRAMNQLSGGDYVNLGPGG